MTGERLQNLVLLDNSWSQGLKTRCFLIACLIFSFLWDFSNGRVHLIFFLFLDQNWLFVIINAMLLSFSIILLDLIEDFSCNNSKTIMQCFEVRWHACILTWFGI
jgi:hypothetical protein